MKANLPQNEPKALTRWEQMRIYERIREARHGAPSYVLHDGPPYANGPIHMGHALNKCLKDFIVKSKNMGGFDAPYIPGWDCHGLPIEIKVDQQLGGKKLQMQPIDVRMECRNYAQKYLDLQREQFKRIGVLGRFEKPYSTMTPEYESVVIGTFYKFFEDGFVYKGLRPVYWCMHDRTALAEAEVEYETHTSPTVFVRYRLQSDPRTIEIPRPSGAWTGHPSETNPLADVRITMNKPVYTIIWTTTPWTLPASMAVAFHPSEEYVALEAQDAIYIIAEKLAKSVAEKCGFPDATAIAHFPGKAMEHTWFYHPFLPWERRKILGVVADYLTMDTGTGVVHTAPSHGAEDFATGVRYQLDPTCDVDAAGIIHNGLPEYDGLKVLKANEPIIELLKTRGALLHSEKVEHQYPHCWRCHNPVIFRATEQWFIQMDQVARPGKGLGSAATKSLRQEALEEIRRVKWIPAWGQQRMHDMVSGRPDWCVSRQRFWGVPIIVFYCDACGKQLRDFAALRNVIRWFEKEGADAWYRHSPEELLPAGTKCSCGAAKWRKENDILDVWFDSGSSNLAVLTAKEGLTENGAPWRPADVYTEGPDQYRGWFQSSLLVAVGIKDQAPYKTVVGHGWTLDEQGRAMSKSLGNAIEPNEICERWGADLLRLWVASVEYQSDVRMSERVMTQLSEAYRKIRNTFRFALINVSDFDPSRDALPAGEMEELDRWMLERAAELVKKCRDWCEAYEFHRVYHAIHDFCVVDLSAFYFDVLKDRLYTKAPRSKTRRSAQTAIYKITSALVRLLAPILVFTAEEIWKHLPKQSGDPASIHMSVFPNESDLGTGLSPKQMVNWERLLNLRRSVLISLEEARKHNDISASLEAKVRLTGAAKEDVELWRAYKAWLPPLFIVSQVEIDEPSDIVAFNPGVSRADAKKCERCWHYSRHVVEDSGYPTIRE